MSFNRRHLLNTAALTVLALTAGWVQAAQPSIDIIAFAHPPVQAALQPLREWLASQGGKLHLTEINMESPDAQARLQALGLTGHLPIVITVNGQYKIHRADGSTVELVSFPASGKAGAGWTIDDVKTAVADASR